MLFRSPTTVITFADKIFADALLNDALDITLFVAFNVPTFENIASDQSAQNTRIDSLSNLTGSYATTGSNTFYGDQNISGSFVPTIDNAFNLGSPTHQFRHLYLSSASLYIDGQKVLGSTNQELQITTDNGQSIKILDKEWGDEIWKQAQLVEFYELLREDYNTYGFSDVEIVKVRRIYDYFMGDVDVYDREHHRKDFYKFFSEHDRRRGTDFVKTFPELEEFWNLCKSIR